MNGGVARIRTDGVTALVGGTPMLRLSALAPRDDVRLYAKLEGFNPTGSIKDRVAVWLLDDAERRGILFPGARVVEASSGNTGISLAMVCRERGYGLTVVMSRKASRERVALLELLGTDIVLTSRDGGADEARRVADELAARRVDDGWVRISQHRHQGLVAMHARFTAGEILSQLDEPIDYVVAGVGTGATVMGLARGIRARYPNVTVIGAHPAPTLSRQEGLRNVRATAPPEIFDETVLTELVSVEDDAAIEACRDIIAQTGVLVGVSSGTALAAARMLIRRGAAGSFVLVFPDRAERYLSTNLVPPAGAV